MQAQTGKPRVVIVGGGFGGLAVARGLRDVAAQITVIDKSNHHVFQPLLYQVATASLSPAEISAPIRTVLRGQPNAEVFMAEVQGVDVAQRRVILADRAIPYDYLVLATGAHHSYFGHDEWEPFAPGLKTLGDATELRGKILRAFEQAELASDPERVRALLTFVIVGAGPTGVEMAGNIAEVAHKALKHEFRHIDPASAHIILVEAQHAVLGSYPPALSVRAERDLEHLGVDVQLNKAVESIDASGVVVSGERIATQTVVWAAGVKASAAGKWLAATGVSTDRAGRVLVSPDLTVPGYPEIFVIGDTASLTTNGKPVPGVAQGAIQSGEYVSRVLHQRIKGEAGTTPSSFHYRDKGNMATIGRASAVVELGRLHLTGLAAWVFWLGVHIFYLIGFRNRILVMVQWAWSYFTFRRGARLIILDEESAPEAIGSPEQARVS